MATFFNKLDMRQDWRFTYPLIQEGGVLELRCEHWMGIEVWKYELILTFGKMKVRAKIRKRIFSNLEWSDIASVDGLGLQETLIWAEKVLDKEVRNEEGEI